VSKIEKILKVSTFISIDSREYISYCLNNYHKGLIKTEQTDKECSNRNCKDYRRFFLK